MRFRKLRIAWSVVWGVVCLVLIVLWARSYRMSYDLYSWWPTTALEVQLNLDSGWFEADGTRFDTSKTMLNGMQLANDERRVWFTTGKPAARPATWRFALRRIPTTHWNLILKMRMWLPTMFCVLMGSLAWLRRLRTLRTLLIATTLVAIVLGLIVAVV
jgi:hypothetical protein